MTAKKKYGCLSWIVCFILIHSATAEAYIICEYEFGDHGRVAGFSYYHTFQVSYWEPSIDGGYVRSATLFENILLADEDAGKVFTFATIHDDPDYEKFVRYITNGMNNRISFDNLTDGTGSGHNANESYFFGSQVANGVDLQGYIVNSVSLQVNRVNLERFKVLNDGDKIWHRYTNVDTSGTIRIDAMPISAVTVPEPGTLILFAIGISALWLRESRRSPKNA